MALTYLAWPHHQSNLLHLTVVISCCWCPTSVASVLRVKCLFYLHCTRWEQPPRVLVIEPRGVVFTPHPWSRLRTTRDLYKLVNLMLWLSDPVQGSHCRCCCRDPGVEMCRGDALFKAGGSQVRKAVFQVTGWKSNISPSSLLCMRRTHISVAVIVVKLNVTQCVPEVVDMSRCHMNYFSLPFSLAEPLLVLFYPRPVCYWACELFNVFDFLLNALNLFYSGKHAIKMHIIVIIMLTSRSVYTDRWSNTLFPRF